jgi:hypothetical protein
MNARKGGAPVKSITKISLLRMKNGFYEWLIRQGYLRRGI